MESDDLREIIDSLDIEAYLDREGIDYRRAHGSSGEQLNVKECPACGNAKWKVYLNAENGLGNCFSGHCEVKFNKFRFIGAYTGLAGRPLVDHLRHIAKEQGWRAPRRARVVSDAVVADLKIPNSFPIPIKGRNLQYLQNRGISSDIAKYFGLRFCMKGMFKYVLDGKDRHMKFDQRIIIPIYDLDGVLVSFQGRDITGTSERKYLFPPGFASTGSHLFNGQNVQNTKRVVVGEGVFDVAALKIAMDSEPTLRDVVPIGTFGKHLSDTTNSSDQVEKFLRLRNERGIEEVTFMWDGEKKAIADAVSAGMKLKAHGFKVRIAILPDGKDPNEVTAREAVECYYKAVNLDRGSATTILMSLQGT